MVLLAWLVVLVVLFGASRKAGSDYETKFQLPNTPSSQAINLLQSQFPAASGSTDQIVLHARSGTLQDPSLKSQAQVMLGKVSRLPHVVSVASPYARGAASRRISKDGTVAFATVTFNEQTQNVPKSAVQQVISTAQSADSGQLQVELGGQDIENAQRQSSSRNTLIGIILALIVLGVAFGALFAALLPIITAIVAVGIGYALTSLLSHLMSISSFAPTLGLLIGLGVGVDYALLILTRYRNGLTAGRSTVESIATAVNTAGRSVFFAGITVCIALLGQFALGVSFLYGVAVSATTTVALTMLGGLTLLPALLAFFGPRVLSRSQRRAVAEHGPTADGSRGFWWRCAKMIERHPVLPCLAALAAVVVIALPVLTLRLGLADAGSDPSSTTTRQAYDLISKGFGPGFNGPLQLVAKLPAPGNDAAFVSLTHTVAQQPGVVAVTPPTISPNGMVAVTEVYPATSPQAAQTSDLVNRLRDDIIPEAEAGTDIAVFVGGTTAVQKDFSHVLSSKLSLFIGVVVAVAFVLLMMVFRSLLIPLVASIMNILSVGTALGLLNAIFAWGWGKSLLGISGTTPVEVFVPVLLFSILFGLSMDYEVFLVSRIREEWVRTSDNRVAVTLGQAETGRVITAAATIMILVFASFVFGGSIIIEQFGLGLAGAIFIDAFLVRTFIVPAIMHMLGRANWWLPKWLDRCCPHLNIEGQGLSAHRLSQRQAISLPISATQITPVVKAAQGPANKPDHDGGEEV